jgi:hypothetical protein
LIRSKYCNTSDLSHSRTLYWLSADTSPYAICPYRHVTFFETISVTPLQAKFAKLSTKETWREIFDPPENSFPSKPPFTWAPCYKTARVSSIAIWPSDRIVRSRV